MVGGLFLNTVLFNSDYLTPNEASVKSQLLFTQAFYVLNEMGLKSGLNFPGLNNP